MAKNTGTGTRFLLLDEIRGFAIVCMVFFHAFYMIGGVFGFSAGIDLFNFFDPAEPFFAGAFIIISGICCRFSHSNLKRGLVLLAVSILLTSATIGLRQIGIDEIIYFGILHCLAVSILLFSLLKPVLDKIPAILQILFFVILFIAFFHISDRPNGHIGIFGFSWTLPEIKSDFLFPLGLIRKDFVSSDYFPVLPWTFLFLAGSAIGKYGQRGKFPRFFCTSHIRPLQFVGQHSLWIYLFHMPVIYIIMLAVTEIFHIS